MQQKSTGPGTAPVFGRVLLCTIFFGLTLSAELGSAQEGPPFFEFKDRCVPYQLTDEFMWLNGINPNRVLGGAGPPPPGGGFVAGPGGGNIQDLDENGNPRLAFTTACRVSAEAR